MQYDTDNTASPHNVDADEIRKFDALAARWWDPDGDFKPLHDINPARMGYIAERTDLHAGPVLDVGCGGGILTEALAREGATVTGIDMAEKALSVARLHAMETAERDGYASPTYLATTAEAMAAKHAGEFHTVTCLEMLEHVSDYPSTVAACAALAQPGGQLFFSTINRTPKAYALLILGAEYVLNILPRGTHDYAKFIRPSELAAAIRQAGLEVEDISGLTYNPFTRSCTIGRDVNANYLLHARKPA